MYKQTPKKITEIISLLVKEKNPLKIL